MTEHVLVPVDGSGAGWTALEHALDRYGGERITALHVVDPLDSDSHRSDAQSDPIQRGERVATEARQRFAEGDSEDTAFSAVVREGKPMHTIVGFADEHDIDQIVIGSRGTSSVDALLVGSVTEGVVARADAPVNVVR